MAEYAADVQSASNELVGYIEELKERRSELDRVIQKEEEEKARVTSELKALTDRLGRIQDSLGKKHAMRQDFDRTIRDTSDSFNKILDSSRLLLSSVKQESLALHSRVDHTGGN